jgi:hypothetical protein
LRKQIDASSVVRERKAEQQRSTFPYSTDTAKGQKDKNQRSKAKNAMVSITKK